MGLVGRREWNASIFRPNIVSCARLYIAMSGAIRDTTGGLLDGINELVFSIRVRRTS